MHIRITAMIVALATSLASSGPLWASEAEAAGLEPVKSRDFDTLLQSPEAAWGEFQAVYVARPEVAFRENWQRNQNRYDADLVKDRDVERIRNDVADLVQELMRKRFEDEGWRLAESPGDGVLVVQPNIVDLDVTAPDVPSTGLREVYSDSAGAMTLDVTLRDGLTGAPLLHAIDHREDPREPGLVWRKRPNNLHLARMTVRGWAKDLVDLVGDRSS
ncbi:MAG: DUF3313 family protein [Xanthomonadales bacterium]|jgi:hypothetical protein|nr:DUF3313 family protein [Xanthomonadales bacterium]